MDVYINRVEIKENAKSILNGKWMVPVLTTLLLFIVNNGMSNFLEHKYVAGSLLSFLIGGPLSLGVASFYLNFKRTGSPIFEDIVSGFRYLLKAFCLMFVTSIFIFLWSLLFIIPGIIAGLRYSQVFFILADNPELPIMEVIRRSSDMMNGYKFDFFILELSFIGWSLLSVLTFGIGFLFLVPYIYVCEAIFYDHLRSSNLY